jgi:hypothetical protein
MSRKNTSPATGGSTEILSDIQPLFGARIRDFPISADSFYWCDIIQLPLPEKLGRFASTLKHRRRCNLPVSCRFR